MHKILTRWHSAGLLCADDVKNKDVKPVPKGAKGELASDDYAAIQRLLQEG